MNDANNTEVSIVIFCDDISAWNDSAKRNAIKAAFERNNRNTIQELHYGYAFDRDEVGTIYGSVEKAMVEFTVRANVESSKVFYTSLKSLAAEKFSFLINAEFDEATTKNGPQYLKCFSAALLVSGYVVDLEEVCSTGAQQAMLRVKILATQLSYLHCEQSAKVTLNILTQ